MMDYMGFWQRLVAEFSSISRQTRMVLALSFLVGSAIFLHPLWFYPHGLLTSGDWTPWIDPSVSLFLKSLGTWGSDNLGQASVQLTYLPFLTVWGGLFSLGFSFAVAEKLTFFIPTALLLVITPFFLSLRFHRRIDVALVVSLFYSTTSGYGLGAVPPIHIVYAMAPLLLLLFIRALERNKWGDWLFFGLIYSIAISYELRIVYVASLILGSWGIFLSPRPYREYIRPVSMVGAFLLVLNAYWWLPLFFISAQSFMFLSRDLFGVNFFDVSHAFTIVHYGWIPYGGANGFFLIPVPWYLWLVPLISFSALLYRRHPYRRHVLFFTTIALSGVFLAKEVEPPLPHLYQWLYDHLPGFYFFREASKFFLLTSLAYGMLIGYSLILFRRRFRDKIGTWVYVGMVVVIIAIACWHNLDFIAPNPGGNDEARTIPEDYRIFNDYLIQNTNRSSTVLWVPRIPRWSFMRRADLTVLLEGRWNFMASVTPSPSQRILTFLSEPYFSELLRQSNIRYIAIPIHDVANDSDFMSLPEERQSYIDALDKLPFLHRLSLPTQSLVVYEDTRSAVPYVSATDSMFRFLNTDNLDAKYTFLQRLHEPFTFFVSPADMPAARLLSGLFEGFQFTRDVLSSRFDSGGVPLLLSWQGMNFGLHIRSGTDGSFSLTQEPTTHFFFGDSQGSSAPARVVLQNKDVVDDYYIGVGDSLQLLGAGLIDEVVDITGRGVHLYQAVKKNLISNPSFEDGLWGAHVLDCNNYDVDPSLGMSLVEVGASDGGAALELWAQRHIACTSQDDIPVEGGKSYVLSFDYRGQQASQAGYYLSFDTVLDSSEAPKKYFIPIADESWHRYTTVISVPQGATSLSLVLYSFPPNIDQRSVNYYDNFSLREVLNVRDIMPLLASPVLLDHALAGDHPYNFQLREDGSGSRNLISNPSFEDGLWRQTIGDCHNYDNRPAIGMSLSPHSSDGSQSLELWAQRHIACTGQDITAPLKPGREYLLRFDYQGEGASQAGYYLSFDRGTAVTSRIYIPDRAWHTYTVRFVVPVEATKWSLDFYSYGSNGYRKAVNRYDNVELRLLPYGHENYDVAEMRTSTLLQRPRSVSFEQKNAHEVWVDVKGARQPFWLTLAEGYDPGWRVNLDRPSTRGISKRLLPVGGIPFLPESTHISLNNYLNGWYMDVPQICAGANFCHLNSDGTYDMQLVLEYWPQRWIHVGVLISLGALVVSLIGLGWWTIQRRTISVS